MRRRGVGAGRRGEEGARGGHRKDTPTIRLGDGVGGGGVLDTCGWKGRMNVDRDRS